MSISVRTTLVPSSSRRADNLSLRTFADSLRTPVPISVRDLIDLLKPIELTFQFDGGTCSGSCEITIARDGTVHYRGRVHNSGALPASYVTITSFPTLSEHRSVAPPVAPPVTTFVGLLNPVVIAHKGHVGGTFSLDTRDSSWDKTTTSENIAENWGRVKVAVRSVRTGFGTNTSAIDFIDAFVSGATGIFIFGL